MNPKKTPDFADLIAEFAGIWNDAAEQVTLAMSCKMRRFYLVRNVDVDPDKISGTGIIAEGVVFEDGKVAMRWKTTHKSTALYDNIELVMNIHGHGGKTVLKYIDAEVK